MVSLSFLRFYLFILERESEHEQWGEAEGEGETEADFPRIRETKVRINSRILGM